MPSAKPVIVDRLTAPITVGIVTLNEFRMYWPDRASLVNTST